MTNLTKEQEAVIHHPLGNHAKILAVAGSGKTTTLVYRIQHLVVEKQINPDSIQVLMFNRLVRAQFIEKMGEVGIPQPRQPKVDTFHSYSYSFVQNLIALGLLPSDRVFWIEDREEQARITAQRAIRQLYQDRRIPPDSVDVEEAYQAIQLWKGSLIPPQRAGYRGNPYIPLVYEVYEYLRTKSNALTYDDFIPVAVSFLEKSPMLRKQYTDHLQHIIVDEYQDVNYGQQRLIELLAGRKADVMVVGDDDQTICEWRGARPNYIIREFQTVFDNKPLIQYNLSHSFRFRNHHSLSHVCAIEQYRGGIYQPQNSLSGVRSKAFLRKKRSKGLAQLFATSPLLSCAYHRKDQSAVSRCGKHANRMLARRNLERLMDAGLDQRLTLAQALEMFVESPDSPLSSRQRERVLELMSALQSTNSRITTTPNIPTDIVLTESVR